MLRLPQHPHRARLRPRALLRLFRRQRWRAVRGLHAVLARLPHGQWSRQRRRLTARLVELAGPEEALSIQAGKTEAAFLAVGSSLEQQVAISSRLAAESESLVRLIEGEGQAHSLASGLTLIQQALAELEDTGRRTTELIAQLRHHDEDIARLQREGALVERAISPLRIIETMFRMEAATLSADTRAAFTALTEEIAELERHVRRSFTEHFEALGGTRTTIASIATRLEHQAARWHELAMQRQAAIRQTVATLESELARNRTRTAQLALAVREIDREGNELVVSLQYQDITRQKTEHVLAALASLHQQAESGGDDRTAALLGQTCRLQAAQLAAIEDDLARAGESIATGVGRMRERIAGVEREYLGAGGESTARIVGAAAGTFATLLGELRGLATSAAESAEETDRAVHEFREVTADLTHTIEDLTWSIRLIALNAQVFTAGVKNCDGLEVLARQTYFVAQETRRSAHLIRDRMSELARGLHALKASARALVEGSQVQRRRLAGAEIAQGVQQQASRTSSAFAAVEALIQRARAESVVLERAAEAVAATRAPYSASRDALERLATACLREVDIAAASAAGSAVLAEHRQRYTMQDERTVHAAALGEPASASTERKAPVAAGDESNVELF